MIYLQLFYEFFKVGLFAIGGGLATLPFLYNLSDTSGWYTYSDVADMIAVSESTPGAIGVNMATYVGYQTAGILGGIVATVGLVLPSIIIILCVARILNKFKDNKIVQGAFLGLRPASLAMIATAGIGVAKVALFNSESHNLIESISFSSILLGVIVYGLSKKTKLNTIGLIAFGAIVGIVFQLAGV